LAAFLKDRRKVGTTLAILVFLLAWWMAWPWPFAAARGRLAARIDQGMGNHVLMVYGLPPPWGQTYYKLLNQRSGVRIRRVAYCIVSESLVDYSDDYDKVSAEWITRKHGRDVFQECADEARRDWERRVAEGKPRQ
jgi:hypothetical protein